MNFFKKTLLKLSPSKNYTSKHKLQNLSTTYYDVFVVEKHIYSFGYFKDKVLGALLGVSSRLVNKTTGANKGISTDVSNNIICNNDIRSTFLYNNSFIYKFHSLTAFNNLSNVLDLIYSNGIRNNNSNYNGNNSNDNSNNEIKDLFVNFTVVNREECVFGSPVYFIYTDSDSDDYNSDDYNNNYNSNDYNKDSPHRPHPPTQAVINNNNYNKSIYVLNYRKYYLYDYYTLIIISKALRYLHSLGLVLNTLSKKNIMICFDGFPRLGMLHTVTKGTKANMEKDWFMFKQLCKKMIGINSVDVGLFSANNNNISSNDYNISNNNDNNISNNNENTPHRPHPPTQAVVSNNDYNNSNYSNNEGT
ncbi:hypothetical protein CDIK_3856, partial [Cucumispora dikerogammari]